MVALSVVIPAHDEEVLLPRLLARLVDDPELEIVVVANGCTDGTAAAARAVSGHVTVVEIDEASKIAALNRGDEVAVGWPRAYVDADVDVDAPTLRALAAALDGEVLVGSPVLRVDTAGATLPVRWYYRIWELTDYRRAGHVGSGIYALSRRGRERFDRFPDVIADDLFVHALFAPAERLARLDREFTVRSPRDWGSLLHRAERIALGNLQLARSEHAAPATSGARSLLRRVAPRPWLWPAFGVYAVGYVVPRRRARRRLRRGDVRGWNRDATTRTAT